MSDDPLVTWHTAMAANEFEIEQFDWDDARNKPLQIRWWLSGQLFVAHLHHSGIYIHQIVDGASYAIGNVTMNTRSPVATVNRISGLIYRRMTLATGKRG